MSLPIILLLGLSLSYGNPLPIALQSVSDYVQKSPVLKIAPVNKFSQAALQGLIDSLRAFDPVLRNKPVRLILQGNTGEGPYSTVNQRGQYVVVIDSSTIKNILHNDIDNVATVLAHELIHIKYDDVKQGYPGDKVQRAKEKRCDLEGVAIAKRAGYNVCKISGVFLEMSKKGIVGGKSHPLSTDRSIYLKCKWTQQYSAAGAYN